jgi:hypothetical protein
LFATVKSGKPRINPCSKSPSRGLFLTCRGENIFLAHGKVKKMYSISNACVVIYSVFLLLGVVALCFYI